MGVRDVTAITENIPGVFGVEAKINSKLEEVANILKEYIIGDDDFRNNGHKRSVTLCVEINEDNILKTYTAKTTSEKTGDITTSSTNKTLLGVTVNLEVKKAVNLSRKYPLVF